MADLVFEIDVIKIAHIIEEDDVFFETVINGLFINGEYEDILIDVINPNRTALYIKIATLLLANNSYISNNSLTTLWEELFLVSELTDDVLHVSSLTEKIYRQILFTYKYSTVNHFFQNNYLSFLPEPESMAIDNSDKLRSHHTAIMHEFDKFSDIIDSLYDITDVDRIGDDYLSYLVQLVGYEKVENTFLTNDSFRQLAKNIIEIYRIKGTSYSIELFFNFLGLRISIVECWFDKRLYYSVNQINTITNSASKSNFDFYITKTKPTDYIPKVSNYPDPYNIGDRRLQIMENELTPVKSSFTFDQRITEGVPILTILDEFTYFKTNHIQYSISSITKLTEESENFNSNQLQIIKNYLTILMPIFIRSFFLLVIEPNEDIYNFVLSENINNALITTTEFSSSEIPSLSLEMDYIDARLPSFNDSIMNSISDIKTINEFSYTEMDIDGFYVYLQDEHNFNIDSMFDEVTIKTKTMEVFYTP